MYVGAWLQCTSLRFSHAIKAIRVAVTTAEEKLLGTGRVSVLGRRQSTIARADKLHPVAMPYAGLLLPLLLLPLLLLPVSALQSTQNTTGATRKLRFEEVYGRNLWNSRESRSGIGSERRNALADMRFILSLVRKRFGRDQQRANVTIVDVPCGDMNWMPELLDQLEKEFAITYYGYDIVPQAIRSHRSRFGSHLNWHFSLIDVVGSPPIRGDVLISRDLVNHLPRADIQRVLSNIKATRSPTLVISNNRGARVNEELREAGGGSRMINIERPPFNWKRAIAGNGHLWLWDDSAHRWPARDLLALATNDAGVKEWQLGVDAGKMRAMRRHEGMLSTRMRSAARASNSVVQRPSRLFANLRWNGGGTQAAKRRGGQLAAREERPADR